MGKKKRQVDHTMSGGGDSSDSNEENQGKNTAINCPHANKAVHLPGVKRVLKRDGLPQECDVCSRENNNNKKSDNGSEDFSLFLCLKCGHSGCGSGSKHAELHSKNKQGDVHDLALNPMTGVVWCYKCNLEVPSNPCKKLFESVEFIKKYAVSSSIDELPESVEKNDGSKSLDKFLDLTPKKELTMKGIPALFSPFSAPATSSLDSLPKVRGLSNLGNTCFFNAVLQCLGQTPFLLPVLEEMREAGESFKLPGGEVQIGTEKEILKPFEGVLKEWGQISKTLADTLSAIQSGRQEVYSPRSLLDLLHTRCPQFAGHDQHDSHELLRQLLEMVRTEDLQRYQTAILGVLNLDRKGLRENITEEMKRIVKAYGRQANDLMLRPEQVFRGFLVSTLECQECLHTSDHIESFLDLSLPVMADKPVHVRRKSSSEDVDLSPSQPSKHQLKKERKSAVRGRRIKHRGNQTSAAGDGDIDEESQKNLGESDDQDDQDHSDADVEDNVEPEAIRNHDVIESGYSSEKPVNGDSACGSPASETNMHVNRDSAIASPTTNDNIVMNKPTDQVLDLAIPEDTLSKDNALISSPGSQLSMACQPSPLTSSSETNLECRLSPAGQDTTINLDRPASRFEYNAESLEGTAECQQPFLGNQTGFIMGNGNTQFDDSSQFNEDINLPSKTLSKHDRAPRLNNAFRKLHLKVSTKEKENNILGVSDDNEDGDGDGDGDGEEEGAQRTKDSWSVTMAQRNHVEPSGDCTLHSCLNQFTAKELMTGNNKVGCEACTKRINQGKEGKTVLTNASKQLLISSPPAILILHLKRFQVVRCTFKKKSREVKFPALFDLAPYCSMKCKNCPTVKRDQNELLYSLYGVVEHSGTLHGGHYVAYVKVRAPLKPDDPRWSFLPRRGCSALSEEFRTDNASANGAIGGAPEPPPGKWYYVSDSRTFEVKEDTVLGSQAYLLFYERIW